MARSLKMTFICENGDKESITLAALKEGAIQKTEIVALMDLIIQKGIFTSGSGAFASKYKAYITNNTITEFDV